MMRRSGLGLVVVCAALARGQSAAPQAGVIRAAEEFKTLTRDYGMREDSPRKAAKGGARRAQFHGRLTENLRNDFLDAVPHEIVQRSGEKGLLRRNQFGFNVSGPVILPKLYDGRRATFFSLSYEGLIEHIGRSYLRTVPMAGERTGDFSQVVDSAGLALEIFDPATVRLNPGYNASRSISRDNLQYVKDPFPAAQIPSSRLDGLAQRALQFYPLPNASAGPYFQNNYFVVSPETNTAGGMIGKVDHTFLEKHRLAVSYAFTNGKAATAQFIQNAADPAPPERNYSNRRLTVEHVFTLSPQSVNTATLEAISDVSENSSSADNWPAQLGLQGVAGTTFPYINLGSYLPMGRMSPLARSARNTFIFSDAFALKRRAHNLRLSAQLVRTQVNTYNPALPSGAFYFGANLTSLPGIVNTGLSSASFLLGGVESADVSVVPSPSYFRNWTLASAVQDTWEIRAGLTMSYGVNLLVAAPRSERYNRQSTVDLSVTNPANNRPGALVFAGRGGYGSTFQPTVLKAQPNWSLAWNPRGNRTAVVRLGYGMSFQGYPIYNGQWGTRGFTGHPYFYSSNTQLEPAFQFSQGVPSGQPLPDLTPTAANDTAATVLDRSGRMPRYQSANLSYERELPYSVVLTVAAGVAWGRDLYVGNAAANPDALRPELMAQYRDRLNDTDFSRSQRPYPQFLDFDLFGLWPNGRYRRQAASLRLEKRTSSGLSLNATYELSRQVDDYSGPYGRQDMYNRHNEWSPTVWNTPQRLTFSYMYELPIGAGKPFLVFQDWRRFMTDGWSVSGLSTVASGEPLALKAMFNNTGGVLMTVRVNTVAGVDPHPATQGPDEWYNPAAFSHPADFSMGDGPRTLLSLLTPGSQNHDVSLAKRFTVDQERSLEFTASAFNVINHADWNFPDPVIGTAETPNTNSGKIIGSHGGRVIQLGLRFSF